jgi:hypothetical protein
MLEALKLRILFSRLRMTALATAATDLLIDKHKHAVE